MNSTRTFGETWSCLFMAVVSILIGLGWIRFYGLPGLGAENKPADLSLSDGLTIEAIASDSELKFPPDVAT